MKTKLKKKWTFEILYTLADALAVNVDLVSPGPFFSGSKSTLDYNAPLLSFSRYRKFLD